MVFPIKIDFVSSLVFWTVLIFLLVPKSIDYLKKKKSDKVNSFFKKRKTNSRHAGIQSKIYQKKKSEWIIKKKEYKCILGKSMPPYTNLSLFLTKKITKGAATVVFVTKVAQGSSFKKDSQFN